MCHKLGSDQALLYPVIDGYGSSKDWSLSCLSPAFSQLLFPSPKAWVRLMMQNALRAAPLYHLKVMRSIDGGNAFMGLR